jgi:hypothetical protein
MSATNVTLPVTLRVPPPPGVATSTITGIEVAGVVNSATVATGQTPLNWPDGASIAASVTLSSYTSPDLGSASVPDMSTGPGPKDMTPADDMSPMVPVWATETSPSTGNLLSVWGDATNLFAVGPSGLVLRNSGLGGFTMDTNTPATANNLNSVSGVAGTNGNAFAAATTGMNGNVYLRYTTGVWNAEYAGFGGTGGLGPDANVLCVTVGATSGEAWAGDSNGYVWSRAGTLMAVGTWTRDPQVFVAGGSVLSIAYSTNTVFATSSDGHLGVRPTGLNGTWTVTNIPSSGTPPNMHAIWAFDASNAVAVGDNGMYMQYKAGSWGQLQSVGVSATLTGVWGATQNEFWITGADGHIFQVNGTYVSKQQPTTQQLNAIYGVNVSNLYAVGNNGTILHGTP